MATTRPSSTASYSQNRSATLAYCGPRLATKSRERLWSETNTGVVSRENFAQLMILENTEDRYVTSACKSSPFGPFLYNVERTWNLFNGPPALTTSIYPNDLDTTSLALGNTEGNSADTRGLIFYLDRTRSRVDIHIAVNILRLFYAAGRAHKVRQTRAYELARAQRLVEHRHANCCGAEPRSF
ncbi:hypothetical protein Micbo1qcDRAFT_220950 [Microdochium bolleyi]|uniref:Uncharacterized protein n=1 Tax=Microdochium bolleyi TaxID=196109 RepID=A0A136JB54_9PEZI|nr:hypothetical protein Micbo1qcDRAFT_220950 [Microdochium bolleyi]